MVLRYLLVTIQDPTGPDSWSLQLVTSNSIHKSPFKYSKRLQNIANAIPLLFSSSTKRVFYFLLFLVISGKSIFCLLSEVLRQRAHYILGMNFRCRPLIWLLVIPCTLPLVSVFIFCFSLYFTL